MRPLSVPARSAALSALALAGALTLSGCGLFDATPTASPSAPATASPAASTSAAPSTPAASPASSGSAAATGAGPSSAAASRASTPAPSSPSAPAAAEASCSGLTGEQALRQAVERGMSADYTRPMVTVDYAAYDDCAELSAIVLTLGNGGLPGMEVQLFHHGVPVGVAPEADLTAVLSPPRRVDDGSLDVTFLYARPGESQAAASGRAVSRYTWDETTGAVVRTGDLPPRPGAAAPATRAPSTTSPDGRPGAPAAETGADSTITLTHAGGVGFCFASPTTVTCYGKHNNEARLPAQGEPSKLEDQPATGWEVVPSPVTLAPGESRTIGPFVCEATAGGFDCANTRNGAGISVAGPTIRLTQPTG